MEGGGGGDFVCVRFWGDLLILDVRVILLTL